METLNPFEISQISLISKYYPYSREQVRHAFILTKKSFDLTVRALKISQTLGMSISESVFLLIYN